MSDVVDDQALEQEHAAEGAPETPPARTDHVEAAAEGKPGIAYNDRTLVLGYTGSGKSELLNHHFSAIRCQKILVDSKDEFFIEGVEPVRDPAELDWEQPVLHYVASTGERDEYNELFEACFRRRFLVVCVHEHGDLCEFHPTATPRFVRLYLTQGRAHGLGLLGGSQRPVEMPKRARTEVQHVFLFVPKLDAEDHDVVAKIVHLSPADLSQLVEETQAEHGMHSFLWFNKESRELIKCPPLPEQVRRRTIVGRHTVA
jgi:hypothetical protein